MRVEIKKSNPIGSIKAPPSKSIAHRLIILAALSSGESTIKNISLSDDIKATLSCIESIGAKYSYSDESLKIIGTDKIKVSNVLNCSECGSTLRFFIPICMLSDDKCILTGSEKLLSRPLSVYERICNETGIRFNNDGKLITVEGKLKSGKYVVPGNISSQFITGLLFVLPLIDGDSTIEITESIESRPYIDLTIQAQKKFGADINWLNENTLFIKGGQKYFACSTENEGDWSNAAFLYALGAEVAGVNKGSLQGDRVCLEHFCSLKEKYCEIDISDCPDLGPILFAYAALNHGGKFTGTRRLKIKESDRAAAFSEELKKFGVNAIITENEVIIPETKIKAPSQPLFGHNDHRIVMSLAVICAKTGGCINGAQAVNKSYPQFFEDIKKLKVKVSYEA
ncbi:MAG: 3-phosphoshikimate 1-carboxyvinyltransferase [Oscillospiraceae bacterium]|nr:3-phosphoshikimate 1-carboxyvinyltransferase [Oscillospiraceae bacterium]